MLWWWPWWGRRRGPLAVRLWNFVKPPLRYYEAVQLAASPTQTAVISLFSPSMNRDFTPPTHHGQGKRNSEEKASRGETLIAAITLSDLICFFLSARNSDRWWRDNNLDEVEDRGRRLGVIPRPSRFEI
ncbi:hypothetical protein Drorol1_Dr00021396 [Drosera rotundifolia]